MENCLQATALLNKQTRFVHVSPDISVSTSRSPLDKLSNILTMVENGLLNDLKVTLVLRKPYTSSERSKRKLCQNYSTININMFASTVSEAWKFTTYIKTIKILMHNITINKVTTKRDIFYQDVKLFQKQSVIDEILNVISFSLNIDMIHLNIIPAQKGLIFGNLTFIYSSGNTIKITTKMGPVLIPILNGCTSITSEENIEEILVLEKEAIFRSVCDPSKPRILITGKGMPDNLTKLCLHKLSISFKHQPIFGFFDSDIYGLLICKNFKIGNENYQEIKIDDNLARSGVVKREHSDNLNCERLIFMGVFLLEYKQGWLDINMRDFKIMKNFIQSSVKLSSSYTTIANEVNKWKREIQRGMFLLKKSEMNLVQQSSPSLNSLNLSLYEYINEKVKSYYDSNYHGIDEKIDLFYKMNDSSYTEVSTFSAASTLSSLRTDLDSSHEFISLSFDAILP